MGRITGWVGLVLALAVQLYSDPLAGSQTCGGCHPTEFARQSQSAHAGALYRATDHPLFNSLPISEQLQRGAHYRFGFVRTNKELRTRLTDGTDVMDLPMEWAFGAGRQAITFVTKVNQDLYVEHYSSYFSATHQWGPTPGQAELQPTTVPLAAGVLYKISDPDAGIKGCFECHSTGPVSFAVDGTAQLGELGVRCEDCHGPGAAHAKKPTRTNIQNPKNLSAAKLNEFCGRCHRPPAAPGQQIDWNVSWNVRHQPLYLNESVCFRKSAGALSCLTCHDPHEPAGKRPAAFYNGRCMGCHSKTASAPKPVCLRSTPANCIDCHMPLVSPQAPLRFTNHWIGVYGEGARLRPLR